MLIGYARVSSDDQNLNPQKDALTRAGCERILEDRQSGAKADRPGLRDALDYARDGDTLTVWRLDRLSRSLKDLIDLVSQLEARGIGLKSLHESIDTTSSSAHWPSSNAILSANARRLGLPRHAPGAAEAAAQNPWTLRNARSPSTCTTRKSTR